MLNVSYRFNTLQSNFKTKCLIKIKTLFFLVSEDAVVGRKVAKLIAIDPEGDAFKFVLITFLKILQVIRMR